MDFNEWTEFEANRIVHMGALTPEERVQIEGAIRKAFCARPRWPYRTRSAPCCFFLRPPLIHKRHLHIPFVALSRRCGGDQPLIQGRTWGRASPRISGRPRQTLCSYAADECLGHVCFSSRAGKAVALIASASPGGLSSLLTRECEPAIARCRARSSNRPASARRPPRCDRTA